MSEKRKVNNYLVISIVSFVVAYFDILSFEVKLNESVKIELLYLIPLLGVVLIFMLLFEKLLVFIVEKRNKEKTN